MIPTNIRIQTITMTKTSPTIRAMLVDDSPLGFEVGSTAGAGKSKRSQKLTV